MWIEALSDLKKAISNKSSPSVVAKGGAFMLYQCLTTYSKYAAALLSTASESSSHARARSQ